MNNFCVFILSHGRPNNVITYKTLRKQGYTGKIYIIIDNEDESADEYYKNYGDEVIMFDKQAIAETFDDGDNFKEKRSVIYARNACFGIANGLGIKYFVQLDDDYFEFRYRYDNENKYVSYAMIKGLDSIFKSLVYFYKDINANSIAIAQTGDFIAGHNNKFGESIGSRRKCMNSFFCSVDRPFKFIGKMNDDVNTYTNLGSVGAIFLTIPFVMLNQKDTQTKEGGLTDLYLNFGTYVKSFYTVMYNPSSVKVKMMNSNHPRLHHQLSWKHTVPCIIRECHKK